jgi:hypothetical protein
MVALADAIADLELIDAKKYYYRYFNRLNPDKMGYSDEAYARLTDSHEELPLAISRLVLELGKAAVQDGSTDLAFVRIPINISDYLLVNNADGGGATPSIDKVNGKKKLLKDYFSKLGTQDVLQGTSVAELIANINVEYIDI